MAQQQEETTELEEEGGGGGGDDGEDQVMSEVHLGCPPGFSGHYTSRFTFAFPRSDDDDDDVGRDAEIGSSRRNLPFDKDGDLVVTRRRGNERHLQSVFTIQHNITSSLGDVGLQVWKAAFVLTDFILHKSFTSAAYNDVIGIELGAGTGLVGIGLARVAKTVFITDKGADILSNCITNARINSSLHMFSEASVRVRELNWKEPWPPVNERTIEYAWSSSEIEEAENASLLLAADVIYSDDLTDAFFAMVEKLMSRGTKKVLYLALEKRYNFSINDLDVVANGYARFRSYLNEDAADLDDRESGDASFFTGKQIDLSQIPQYIREYERGKDLELWKITYHIKRPHGHASV